MAPPRGGRKRGKRDLRSELVGLCHVPEHSDEPIPDVNSRYRAGGEVVKAKIVEIDAKRRRVSLGSRKRCFHSDTIDGTSDDDHERNVIPHRDRSRTPRIVGYQDSEPLPKSEHRPPLLPLQVTLDDSEGSDQEAADKNHQYNRVNEVDTKKGAKRLKKKERKQRELEISAVEERALQQDVPRAPDEFEKLVRSSPNSSFLWIKYMACLLDLADVEKARAVAERALKTVSPREEAEKLNIWIAYLNLENEHGSPREDAVKKVFQRALQYCDSKKVHLALLAMYERTKQYELADELLDRTTKRFKTSCKIWLCCIRLALKQGKGVECIKSIVNRAVLCLPERKHIKFHSQTAILEFKCGVPEERRLRFELILRDYPKRTDLWSVYLDQEIRLGDPEIVRAIFERATCLTLPPKKMQFLFTKYLKYEQSQGSKEREVYVKQKAIEHVQTSLPSPSSP